MRILLAHNSLYYPSYGGGDKSNRLLMEALAARGHQVRVVSRVESFGVAAHNDLAAQLASRGIHIHRADGPGLGIHLNGVDVRVLTRNAHWRVFFASHVHAFDPDIILTSTDDPAQLLLDIALRAHRARVVYLVRATVAAPFGPESGMLSPAKTEALREVDGAVAVSEYVAEYTRRWSGIDAVHVPISLLPPGDCPLLGRFDNRFIGMVNPCGVKGLPIFIALARGFPQYEFAAIPSWGTTAADLAALETLPNVSLLGPFDNFDDFLSQTRIMLVPSLWAEARSRVILEAMSRGIPVLASDVGGLREAKLGVDYLLPVNPVTTYRAAVDHLMVPAADIPPQDPAPWQRVLQRLLTDRAHYDQISAASRKAALEYAGRLTVEPFERYLSGIVGSPRRRSQPLHSPRSRVQPLSAEKRKLLALRLKAKQD
jgi:glycosyltransferase involved in cell wall biosynthesis